MPKNAKYAILSFSGGLDSTSLLINLIHKGFQVQCITFDYGQNHSIEIERASANIKYLKNNLEKLALDHKIVDIRQAFDRKSSSLLSNQKSIPKGYYQDTNMLSTFVPNRNAIFTSIIFSYALSWSKELSNQDVHISLGCHAGDHLIYPDCRPEFYKTLIDALKIGNWGSESICKYMPYINYSKAEIIRESIPFIKALNLDYKELYKNTNTSYSPSKSGASPGNTGSDVERILAFYENKLEDPIEYEGGWESALQNAIKIEQDYKKTSK